VQDPQAGIEEKVSVVWLHEYKMTGHIGFVKTPLGKFLVEKMAYYGYLMVTSPSGQMLANAAKWSQMASADVELGLHDREEATVLLVQETGWKKVTVDEARRLIREATPVVVAYQDDERPAVSQPDTLRKGMGPARPDSEAVARTFARVLRPGTLVFILSRRENSSP
jgi:hypothetical protein